jgi:hypothetical protein
MSRKVTEEEMDAAMWKLARGPRQETPAPESLSDRGAL